MDVDRDYSSELLLMLSKDASERLPLYPHHVVLAERVVLKCFPPKNTEEVFKLLTALNLLNAAVKQPWGKKMVSYHFIKGYASMLLQMVFEEQIPGVDAYWDSVERIAYFRVYGIQLGFHYIPFTPALTALLPVANRKVQQWDGFRLQLVAVEIFLLGNPEVATVDTASVPLQVMPVCMRSPLSVRRKRKMHKKTVKINKRKRRRTRCLRPYYARSMTTLFKALTFRIDRACTSVLLRRRDHSRITLCFYLGGNYQLMMNELSATCKNLYLRARHTLKKGCLYYVSPQRHIESLSPSRRLHIVAKYCYVWDANSNCYHNLCVTYGIARYLTAVYPSLRFINLLNFNRCKVRDRYYTHAALVRVPLHSKARVLKIWMVVDRENVLAHYNAFKMPPTLVREYYTTPDYYEEFELTRRNGRMGIRAYCRHHLLPPVYREIIIRSNFAYVMRDDGKIAVYALQEECFKSDFIYDRVWYVQKELTTYGEIDGAVVIICQLHPEMPFGEYGRRRAADGLNDK